MPKIEDGFGRDMIEAIDKQKKAWAIDERPLSTGHPGPPGPFDKPEDTIAFACKASEGWKVLELLYTTVLMLRPQRVLELGTNVGVSSAYIAAALKAAGEGGRVHTIDASPYRQGLARTLHSQLGLDNVEYTLGVFYEVLPDLLEKSEKFDFAFIDGQHELKATIHFFQEIAKAAGRGAFLVFDDIELSDQMKQAWRTIRNDPRVYVASEAGNLGFVILGSGELALAKEN